MKSLKPISIEAYEKLPLGKRWAYDIWYELNWFNKVTLKEVRSCWGKGHNWYKIGDREACRKCGKLVPPIRFTIKELEVSLEEVAITNINKLKKRWAENKIKAVEIIDETYWQN